MSIYHIKPQFQNLLRPLVKKLATWGVTANQVTLLAAIGSLLLGSFLFFNAHYRIWFLLIPVWMFLRMALNAIDGMLAREFGQKSPLGAVLNELCDVISDSALYLPFAFILPFNLEIVGLVIVLAILSEFTGVLTQTIGASRRYDGPMGKSDRAFVFGALGIWVAVASLPQALYWLMPIMALLIVITIIKRVKNALAEAAN